MIVGLPEITQLHQLEGQNPHDQHQDQEKQRKQGEPNNRSGSGSRSSGGKKTSVLVPKGGVAAVEAEGNSASA